MPRRLALIASSLAVALLLVGCGSDDDSSDDGDTTTTEAVTSTTTEAEADDEPDATGDADDDTTTASTEAPDEATTTTTGEGGEGGDGDPDFCAAYAAFDDSFDEMPDDTLEDIQAGSEAIRDALADLEGLAPPELADHMARLAQAGEDLLDAVNGASTLEEAETAGAEVFTDDTFTAAAEAVDTYYRDRCPEANDDQASAGSSEG